MENKKYMAMYTVIGILPLIYFLMVFGTLPETIPTHFDATGVADALGSKMLLIIMPLVNVALVVMAICIPHLMKNKKSKDDITKYDVSVFTAFTTLILVMFSLISINIIYSTANYVKTGKSLDIFSMMYMIYLFFIVTGLLLPRLSQNRLFGIRFPFTLRFSEFWNKTHDFAGKTWVLGSIIGAVTTYITSSIMLSIGILLIMVVLVCLYAIVLFYKK